jgi:hypothetical protein
MTCLILILGTILASVLYRMGGSANYHTKFRDLGVPTVVAVVLLLLGAHTWWLILTFGLMFGALTTYWKGFYMHGLLVGLSLAPVVIATGHWAYIIPVAVILSLWAGIWSKIWNWDIAEEAGRLLPLIPLLLLIV